MTKQRLILSMVLTMVFGLTGCANTQTQFQTTNNPPMIAPPTESIVKKQECAKQLIANYISHDNPNVAFIFFIRNITDGRVSGLDVNADNSSSENKMYLSGSLLKLHDKKHQVFIMDNMPKGFTEDLLGSAYPSQNLVEDIIQQVKRDMDQNRQSPVDSVVMMIIDASFTRFDKESNDQGLASSFEYSKNSSAEFSFGKTNSQQFMNLTVNLVDPLTNSIVESETFEIKLSQNKKDRTFKVARKGFGIGVTDEITMIDSVHGAQNVLLDYAAMWILDQFNSDEMISKTCKV